MNVRIACMFRRPVARAARALATVALATLTACAGPRLDAQWTDPTLGDARPLAGARLLVACQAPEVVLARLCTDRLRAQAQQRGLQLVDAPLADAPLPPNPSAGDAAWLERARAAQATALWITTLTRSPWSADGTGPGFSIGMGGIGIGRHGGVGVGVGVPIGSRDPQESYAADARISTVDASRLLWTARVRADRGGDTEQQIADLVQRLADAAGQAKLF